MSHRPISPTFDLQAIHFSLTRRWTIKTGQAMLNLVLPKLVYHKIYSYKILSKQVTINCLG
jgi:hypothetical protein